MRTQLCWSCDRATGGCSWSHNGTPIKGWKAKKTRVRGLDKDIDSYLIKECPLFKKETERKIKTEYRYMTPGQIKLIKDFAELIEMEHKG